MKRAIKAIASEILNALTAIATPKVRLTLATISVALAYGGCVPALLVCVFVLLLFLLLIMGYLDDGDNDED